MGRCIGGKFVEGKLNELRVALQDYYGGLEELRANVRQDVPEMPEALMIWKQCKTLGVPYAEGGLIDQPHLWLLELRIVIEAEETFAIINAPPPQVDAQ